MLAYTIRPLKSKIKHLFSMDFPGSKKCWQFRTGYANVWGAQIHKNGLRHGRTSKISGQLSPFSD